MMRHLLRAGGVTFVLAICLLALPGQAKAQSNGVFDDPFAFYYAFYLPNQQLQALRPTPMDSINQAMVSRQYYAQNDRRALYNPITPYGSQDYDPLRPYSQQGQERIARPFRFAQDSSNADGSGPSLYYNRSAQYFPGLAGRDGRSKNANVYAGRRSSGGRSGMGRSGGMGGMGGMGGGMGGMGGMGGGMF